MSLDGIVSVIEGGQSVAPLAARADAPEAALPIEPGLQEILASLTVIFAIS